ncbi:HAAS signaling domain-containing protein [Metabacillus litoralis]|uniref:HAAS signaling domain-containing protein n=1 Tax=Metabacillus litoralis TaxID=152268 RepID=UPI001CFE42E7|nr:DUF1700 domain-containing protein [Metabacillus litoralis]
MNKQKFLGELSNQLKSVPQHDRSEMLYDFEEHFKIGIQEGKSEEEISQGLGNPRVIAKDLLVEYRVTQAETDQSVKSMFNVVLATISLSFFNIIFLLGPIVAIIGVYIALSAVALGFTLSPIAWIVSLFFSGLGDFLLGFFASVILCSLGVLMSIGMIYVGKFLYKVILKYIRFNIRIAKGGESR